MNNYCCVNCFSDAEIKRFIKSDEKIGNCDYCQSRKVHICNVNDVGDFIMEGFLRRYEDAANQVEYCSSDGGYQLPTSDIADILLYQEEIFGEGLADPNALLKDLVINDGTPYVRKDPYGPPSADPDEIRYWENFCKTIKTKQRFTVFLSSEYEDQYDHSQPKNFLFYLANNFMPTLIDVLQPGTKIYRARINNENSKFSHKDLTSPPPQRSRNSRMSPAGISFFYGGMNPEVCIHEVRPNVAENIVVAEFEVVQELFVLNLANDFEAGRSIFDPDYSFYYEEYFKPFIEHFARDVSKPIRQTDNEIEYVPTQVFTEFIRTINFRNHFYWEDANGNKSDVFVNGIQFKSSIMKDGTNLVLFRGPEISTTDSASPNGAWLLYKKDNNKNHQVTEIRVKSKMVDAQSNA